MPKAIFEITAPDLNKVVAAVKLVGGTMKAVQGELPLPTPEKRLAIEVPHHERPVVRVLYAIFQAKDVTPLRPRHLAHVKVSRLGDVLTDLYDRKWITSDDDAGIKLTLTGVRQAEGILAGTYFPMGQEAAEAIRHHWFHHPVKRDRRSEPSRRTTPSPGTA